MTRGLGGWLVLTEQRNFTSNLLPIYLGALGVHYLSFDRAYQDDAGRKGLLKIFDLLGNQGELVSKYRRLLAQALN